MEHKPFAIGAAPQETKQQKRERLRKKNKPKKPKAIRHFTSFSGQRIWRILPKSECDGLDAWIDRIPRDSYLKKLLYVENEIQSVKSPRRCPFQFPKQRFQDEYIPKATKVLGLLQRNQDLRWTFKKLLNRIRIYLMKQANEVDPITMDTIKQPIKVYSYTTRKIYTFEAESFSKHIHKNLVLNDGQIPTPQFPKNPLTNEVFTQTQLMGLVYQCKQYGYSSWAIEAIKASDWKLPHFFLLHGKALRLQAIRATMAKVTDWDCIDTVFDFIRTQHRVHLQPCQGSLYKWAVNHAPNHEVISKWRRICLKWYESDILIDDPDVKDNIFKMIEDQTKSLCEIPKELIKYHLAIIKRQRTSDKDGSSDSGDS